MSLIWGSNNKKISPGQDWSYWTKIWKMELSSLLSWQGLVILKRFGISNSHFQFSVTITSLIDTIYVLMCHGQSALGGPLRTVKCSEIIARFDKMECYDHCHKEGGVLPSLNYPIKFLRYFPFYFLVIASTASLQLLHLSGFTVFLWCEETETVILFFSYIFLTGACFHSFQHAFLGPSLCPEI